MQPKRLETLTVATEKLTDVLLRALKPADKPKKLADGGGLYVEVQPSGAKYWRLKYRVAGVEKRLSLGVYPATSLKDARRKADEARALVGEGTDPSEVRKDAKADTQRQREAERLADAGLPPADSFEAVAREWLVQVHGVKTSKGHTERTRIRLEQDAFPWIGHKALGAIKAPELLECLRRVEARGAIETAHRLNQSCGQVFRYGIATGRCERDPGADLRDALTPIRQKHHAAITDPRRVGELLRAMADYRGMPTTRAALQLAPLVFQRPGELRNAEWVEMDLEAGLWTIPAERMKCSKDGKANGAAHVVPLAVQAVAVLRDLQPLTGHGRYVFPSPRTSLRPMSENGVLSALRRMGFPKDEMTGHGFRAMARTMLAERLDVAENLIEAQLAHSVRDSLGRAYNRTEFIAQRRAMMQAKPLDKSTD